MIDITTSVEIERNAAAMFEYLADFENNPPWQRGMRSASWTSQPPVAVGSTYDQIARFVGREIRTSFEVTALEPARSITITSTAGSFPVTITRTVAALGAGRSKATAHVSGDSSRFLRIADPIAQWLVRRAVTGDYARLKQILENS
jgi:hypothetical protein